MILNTGPGAITAFGDAGDDIIKSEASDGSGDPGAGILIASGGADNDQIFGSTGDDTLNGDGGNDGDENGSEPGDGGLCDETPDTTGFATPMTLKRIEPQLSSSNLYWMSR